MGTVRQESREEINGEGSLNMMTGPMCMQGCLCWLKVLGKMLMNLVKQWEVQGFDGGEANDRTWKFVFGDRLEM